MFGNNWTVAVRFIATGNLGQQFATISRSATLANSAVSGMNTKVAGIGAAAAAASRSMDNLRIAAIGAGTAISGALAGVGIAGMGTALSDAAQLQQTLLSIKNETGASSAQLGAFYNSAFRIANQNGMTPEQGGEMLRTISRLSAGQFDVAKMIQVAPTVADFASKVHFNRPDIGVDEAAKTGIQFAHLFQAYQPTQLAKLLDSAYRLSGLMAEKPDAALRQMSYYVPLFKSLKIGDETSIAMMALLDRAGFRNKVGTNVRALALESLGPLQLTSRAQKGKESILTQMGLFRNGKFAWNTPDGGMDFFGELGAIGDWARRESAKHVPASKIAQEMVSALGKQGATVGALFLNDQMPGILDGIRKYLNDPNVGLKAATANRDQSLGFQFSRAVSNLNAVMTELGYPWLADMTKFFKGLGDNLHGFQAWLHGHRDAEKQIGEVVAGFTAIMGIRFTVGTAQALFAGASALGIIGKAAPGVSLAAKAFTLLDGLFLAGMGGRVLRLATNFAVLNGAFSSFAAVMGGSAVAGVPGALLSLRTAIVALGATGLTSAISSFATIMGGSAVAGVPAILSAVSLGLAGLAVPLATIAGIVAVFRPTAAGGDEGTLRAGKSARTYGTAAFWERFAKTHGGWSAVPQDVRNALHPANAHAPDEVHHHGSVSINVTVKGDKDAQKTGQVVGAAVAHHLAMAGLIRNHPVAPGMGNAVPATH